MISIFIYLYIFALDNLIDSECIYIYIYIYTKRITMCPPGYHHNGFMATPELGHRMYGYTLFYSVNKYTISHIYTVAVNKAVVWALLQWRVDFGGRFAWSSKCLSPASLTMAHASDDHGLKLQPITD